MAEEARKHPTPDSSEKDQSSLKEFPMLWLKGFLMGSADVVPGVSGGTMALILGIYERLLSAIKSVNGAVLRDLFSLRLAKAVGQIHLLFLVMLISGIATALAFFTKIVPLQVYMFSHPEIVFGLFFGLILGSIYVLVKAIEQRHLSMIVFIVVGTAIGLWVVQLVPTQTPEHPLFVFFSGVIAITAMILPGISGSYLLLIMRKYDFVLSNIGKLGGPETMEGFLALLPFIVGAVVGLALFSRVLSWLLARYHRATLSVLIGFLLGSLLVIWPFQDREYIEQVREVEVMLADDPTVQDLPGVGDDAPALPEYKRVVPAPMESSLESSLVDQEPSTQESKEGTPEGEVFVETVKRKLISSTPYWPDATNEPNRWMGFTSILMGLLLVAGLERLR